jgi:hypothetical protein
MARFNAYFSATCVLFQLLSLSPVIAFHSSSDGTLHKLNVDAGGHLYKQLLQDVPLATGHPDGVVMRRESTPASSHRGGEDASASHVSAMSDRVVPINAPLKTNRSDSLIQAPPLTYMGLRCNTPIYAPADPCPIECPYMAEDSQYICHFRCLTADACGTLDPLAKIPDPEQKMCRRCAVVGCKECAPGNKDQCMECSMGYSMRDGGTCWSKLQWAMFGFKCLLALLSLIVVLWLLELCTRKRTNWSGLKHGLAYRWRTRIHMPKDTPEDDGVDDTDNQDEQIHELLVYPLSTNMLRQPIAGPGTCLHFNFEVAVLIWAIVICYAYALTCCMVSTDMLVLGLSPAKTSQQLCSVVRWGHDAQMRNMWAKCVFIIFAYVFTFVGCIYFGIYQNKDFFGLDSATSMKDFACFIIGLPKVQGKDNLERKLTDFIAQKTRQKVVGVSVCWNYTEKSKEVTDAIEADWAEREAALKPPPPEEDAIRCQPRLGFLRRQVRKLDGFFYFATTPSTISSPDAPTPSPGDPIVPTSQGQPLLDSTASPPVDMKSILEEMESSDCAFAVFETEVARDLAVLQLNSLEDDVEYEGSKLKFEVKNVEPGTARFSGLAYGSGREHRAKKIKRGTFVVLGCLLIWAGCFYFPYAFYSASFSYAHGEEPPMFSRYFFTFLVVGGNQAMYFLADVVSQRADFMFEDDREVAYNIIYVLACVTNTIADLAMTVYLSYKMMVSIGIHTADGRLLENLDSFEDIFESYPIQKALGEMHYIYCFPACFLYPFILEGVFTISLPYFILKNIVLSHDEVQDREAELSMQYFLPMNLGRYGDIILNMILAVFVFFCPGGYTLPIFLGLLFSHIVIYAYDHYRVLRCTPNFCYATTQVDRFGQLQLIMPTGLLASCAVFRCSQWLEVSWMSGWLLYALCSLAFFFHALLHWACLEFLVPMFNPKEREPSKDTYADCAKDHAINWFTSNPVHCLRSKYIFKHNPPAVYAIYGKEHLVKANPDIGVYFEDQFHGGAYKMNLKLSEEEQADKLAEEEAAKEEEEDSP